MAPGSGSPLAGLASTELPRGRFEGPIALSAHSTMLWESRGDRSMKRLIAVIAAAMTLVIMLDTPSRAQTYASQPGAVRAYSDQENRAWTYLSTYPITSRDARIMGKRTAVQFMKWVCDALSTSWSWYDIEDFIIKDAMRRWPADVGKQNYFMRFAFAETTFAILNICPQHRKQAGLYSVP